MYKLLFSNGDFTTRSNDVETICRRVNLDDFDGDGLANEIDPNPLVCDGDFFGPANILPDGANNLVAASIELFRDGDVCVTTNGIAAHLPRELPFEHHGFGQDGEWVATNFTNATGILAVGYPQWVDDRPTSSIVNSWFRNFSVGCDGRF